MKKIKTSKKFPYYNLIMWIKHCFDKRLPYHKKEIIMVYTIQMGRREYYMLHINLVLSPLCHLDGLAQNYSQKFKGICRNQSASNHFYCLKSSLLNTIFWTFLENRTYMTCKIIECISIRKASFNK